MKLNIGFWNVRDKLEKNILNTTELIKENDLDIMCFAETGANFTEMQLLSSEISQKLKEKWIQPRPNANTHKRTELISRLPSDLIKVNKIDDYFSTITLTGSNKKLLLQIVHFPSLLNRDRADVNATVKQQARIIRDDFLKAKTKAKADGYIVLGDFNLNPFDDAIMAADGFNATNDSSIAEKETRKIDGTNYSYTYNPCWSLLCESPLHVPGSYYYTTPGASTQHWQTIDQVIFCPVALKSFVSGSLQRIVKIDKQALLRTDRTGVKRIDEDISDHLPIAFSIDI